MTQTELTVQSYHEQSKHSLDRYARGPQTLDWDAQPNPFRNFEGSPKLPLPLTAREDRVPYADLYIPGAIAPRPLDRTHIGLLLEVSMGLSAWKSYGPDRWALRCNPSSGNLHPTEAYLLLPALEGMEAGLYHYNSHDHCLELRCTPAETGPLTGDGFLVGLSSVHVRESWKYGERAFRYCQHDVGHALAALRYACGLLGWTVRLLDDWSDEQVAALLGLDREGDFENVAHEAPDLLLQVSIAAESAIAEPALAEACRRGQWQGRANALCSEPIQYWALVDQAAKASHKPVTPPAHWTPPSRPPLAPSHSELTASVVMRQRRSAQAFDGQSILPLADFVRMLDCTLPRPQIPPLDILPWAPRLHLALFIHRVEGLAPGLYALPRSEDGESLMRQALRQEFTWEKPEGLPEGVPLYLLVRANAAKAAGTLACHQPIASRSAFSLAMLAEFDATLAHGPWFYRQLYWEAGAIGQALYLEAEAAGVRATGIGCYFDDAVHETLGVTDTRLQDMYHFTVGMPVVDNRLVTTPPYSHLAEATESS